jgi:CheY-like chemotaxis protein
MRRTSTSDTQVNMSEEKPRIRVLVVDDDVDYAALLAERLEREGHEVHTASDAESAILELVTVWPDVAIVDIGLPVVDGYELAERFRKVGHCKLIALSGYSAESARTDTVVTSFDRHLLKPVNVSVLLQAITDLA